MKNNSSSYDWKFCTIGGVTRVMIKSGQDIAHLGELDKKLWTVLSCPVDGLEIDPVSLAAIDSDADGKIRVDEVVATAKWLTTVLKDPELLVKRNDVLPLSAINDADEQGAAILASAKQILSNLGLEKDEISVADTADSVAIFAKTGLNGDGVITAQSTADEKLQAAIAAIVTTLGASADRSGLDGVDADKVNKFYELCEAYAAWSDAATSDILPYGADTEAALAACEAIKAKVADYFMRCKLAAFDADSTSALDVSVERISAISAQDLSACADEIASYPLARITGEQALPFNGINPAWQAAFDALKASVLDREFPGAESITEAQWKSVLAKFDAYVAWKGAKAGTEVEPLGLEAVKGFIADAKKDALLKLVEDDLAVKPQADAIDAVIKFMHLYRDFYGFLGNYVTFNDFYAPDVKAAFQAGTLYIDQRCCELCMKVKDMGASAAGAGLSGMFLVYCTCTSKTKGKTMNIVAAITKGEVNDLRPGKHAVFYDREGGDWDATVVNIVENPISVGQAFWTPYRKLARLVEDKIAKTASEKSSKVTADMTSKVENAEVPEGAPKKAPFDIAKFTGILAAAGLAFGAILAGLGVIASTLASLKWWQLILVIIVVLLIISAPSMILAYLKLRKRNISPLLNANGWAMNSLVKVNIKFGNTMTSQAKLPKVAGKDPFGSKTPSWLKWLLGILVVAAAVFAYLYTHHQLPCQKKAAEEAVEEVIEAPADSSAASSEAPVEVVEAAAEEVA